MNEGGKVARAIASTWWRQVSDGGIGSLPDASRNGLVRVLSDPLRTSKPFDDQLIGVLEGTNQASNDFCTALTGGASVERSIKVPHPDLISNLASLTMNIDVSCTRCHDSMVGHRHGKQEHWSFAAVLAGGLKPSGKTIKRHNKGSTEGLFFVDLDQKGRIAEPSVPALWLDADLAGGECIDSIEDWTRALR